LPAIDILSLATAETLALIDRHLASAALVYPSRVLEVGCGLGHLAFALSQKGMTVCGIDANADAVAAAKSRGVSCVHADFLTYEFNQDFDLLLFTRSLHHIAPLDLAVKKAAKLLAAGGLVIVEDFGYELADADAVSWLGEKKTQALTLGLLQKNERHRETTAGSLERWRLFYEQHHVADSQTMFSATSAWFSFRQVESGPYLYRYLLDLLVNDERGLDFARQLLDEEKSLIAANEIAAVGWRLICAKTCG
jgi:SAM-dependent methyltransferase